MENQVLSIERMRHLQELGIELGKTLLYWARSKDNNPRAATHYGKWILTKGNSAQVVGMTSWEFVPAFTLQDIIELLPDIITFKRTDLALFFTKEFVGYYDDSPTSFVYAVVFHREYESIFDTDGEYGKDYCKPITLIEAAYQMLCWCAENGYLKGGEK